jgi:hypothetical protein
MLELLISAKDVAIQFVAKRFVNISILSVVLMLCTPNTNFADEGLDASLSGGYMASFLSEETSSSYTARLTTDGPIAGLSGFRIRNRLDLGLLPGEGSVENVDTYNSVEYAGRISAKLADVYIRESEQKIWTSIYLEGGFGALRKKSENPAKRDSPVWMGGGILFEERIHKAHLSVGLYADQRLDGLYQPTIVVSGGIEIDLDGVVNTDKLKMSIVGDAVLGINDYGKGAGRQVRIGVMIGI